ncbi:MAG TPA: phosphatase PAP2 family protein [Pseudolabrys sp.]
MGLQHTDAPHATDAYTRHIWILIAVMAASTAVTFMLTGLRVDPLSRPLLLVPFSVLGATWWFYTSVRPDRRLQALAEGFTQVLLILLFGTLLSYAAAAVPFPFQDATLLSIDNALGIDRQAYIGFFSRRPWLYNATMLAYFTLMPQFVLVPLVLFFKKQPHRLQQFTFAAGIGLSVTVAISVFTPSITTVYLDLGLPVYTKIPEALYTPVPTLEALRSGTRYWVDLSAIEGLISFPSFHTVAALLFIWALRTVALIRWIALIINASLIAAAPIVGSHYFIDLAGGAVVALLAVMAAHWLSRRASSPRPAMDGILEGQAAGIPELAGYRRTRT